MKTIIAIRVYIKVIRMRRTMLEINIHAFL